MRAKTREEVVRRICDTPALAADIVARALRVSARRSTTPADRDRLERVIALYVPSLIGSQVPEQALRALVDNPDRLHETVVKHNASAVTRGM
jgi:molybdopterin-guanine dinucleotide biosynthesis protein A